MLTKQVVQPAIHFGLGLKPRVADRRGAILPGLPEEGDDLRLIGGQLVVRAEPVDRAEVGRVAGVGAGVLSLVPCPGCRRGHHLQWPQRFVDRAERISESEPCRAVEVFLVTLTLFRRAPSLRETREAP